MTAPPPVLDAWGRVVEDPIVAATCWAEDLEWCPGCCQYREPGGVCDCNDGWADDCAAEETDDGA